MHRIMNIKKRMDELKKKKERKNGVKQPLTTYGL